MPWGTVLRHDIDVRVPRDLFSDKTHHGPAVRKITGQHEVVPAFTAPPSFKPAGSLPYSNVELEFLAQHCTEEEDAANKVERQVAKSAAALLLESRIGEQFDAVVTGASSKGTWARLLDVPVEGKLVRGFKGIDVGDRIRVQLLEVDVERGYIDFSRVGGSRR